MMTTLLVLLFSSIGSAHQHTEQGLRYFESFEYHRALLEFQAAVELVPDSEVARINLGLTHYYLGRFEDSRAQAQIVLEANPEEPFALFLSGVLEKLANRPAEASNLFRKVLAIDPEDSGSSYQLGLLAFGRGAYVEAAEWFESARAQNPEDAGTMYNLARSWIRGGREREGKDLLEKFQSLQRQKPRRTSGGMGEPSELTGKYARMRPLP